MTEKHTCCEKLFSNYRSYACGKPAKAQDEKGNWFCGIHSPEAKAKRKARSDEKFEAWRVQIANKNKRQLENRRRLEMFDEMLSALRRASLALAFAAETSDAMRDDYEAVSAVIAKATGETK